MSVFDFPIEIKEDSLYLEAVKKRVSDYLAELSKLKTIPHLLKYVPLIDDAIGETLKIKTNIVKAFNSQFNGKAQTAIRIIVNLIERYKTKLITPILDSYAFLGNDYYAGKRIDELFLYKGRIGKPYSIFSCEDMFHIPLNLRKVTKTQRYSMPGIPCIYLAQNSFVVWKEMEMPSFDTLSISAFKIEDRSLEMIDLTYPFKAVFEILQDYNFYKKMYNDRTTKIVLNTLSIFPLVAAVSVKCREDNRNFKSEYVIPQLLMYCLKDNVVGIGYHSNEIDSANNMFATNIAIPVINFSDKQKYGSIKKSIALTDPLNFDYFNKVYNNSNVLNNSNIFAKGIGAREIFSSIQPISSFNKLIQNWPAASYDKDIEYSRTPFYCFDDYVLYLKKFNTIK